MAVVKSRSRPSSIIMSDDQCNELCMGACVVCYLIVRARVHLLFGKINLRWCDYHKMVERQYLPREHCDVLQCSKGEIVVPLMLTQFFPSISCPRGQEPIRRASGASPRGRRVLRRDQGGHLKVHRIHEGNMGPHRRQQSDQLQVPKHGQGTATTTTTRSGSRRTAPRRARRATCWTRS